MSWDLLLFTGLSLIFFPLVLLFIIFYSRRSFFQKTLKSRSYLRQLVLLLTLCYFTVILIFTSYSLRQIESNIRAEATASLKAVNASTEHALNLWSASVFRHVHHFSTEDELFSVLQVAQQDQDRANKVFASSYLPELTLLAAENLEVRTLQGELVVSLLPQSETKWQQTWQLAALNQAKSSGKIYIPPVLSELSKEANPKFYFISTFSVPSSREQFFLIASFDSVKAFAIFTDVAKISRSGETYVIDSHGRMLSASRFSTDLLSLSTFYPQFKQPAGWLVRDPGVDLMQESKPAIEFSNRPLTLMAQQVVSGRSGSDQQGYRDYRGVRVLGDWRWSPQLQLALVTEIDEKEALAPFQKLKQIVFGALLSIVVISLILLVLILWLGERISLNLRKLVSQSHHQLETALQQLKTTESTRTLALEAAKIGIWHFDVRKEQWWWDGRCSEIAGVEDGQKDGLFLKSILHPEDRALLSLQLHQAIAKRSKFDVEFRIYARSGDIRFLRARASANVTEQFGFRVDGILLDVTEIKRAEESARLIRERNQLILNYAGDGIIGLDPQGHVTFCNAAAIQMLGYSEAELVGQDLHPLVHYAHADGRDYPAECCPMRMAARSGETYQVDVDVLWRQTGESFPVEYTAVPLKQNDQIVGSVVVFRDITERKKNEQRIIAREQQITKILEASPDPLVITDSAARIVSVNKRTEQIFGYNRTELIGQFIEILLPERFRTAHIAMRDGFIRQPSARLFSQTAKGRSFIAMTATGHEFPIELSLNPMETEDGLFIVSAIHDLTERHQAEHQLRSREERFALSTAGSGDGLWDFQLNSGQYWFSERFKSLLGYAELDESLGMQAWFDLIHPEDKASFNSAFHAHLSDNTTFDYQHRLRCADHSWRWFRARGQALRDANNQAYRVAGSITDITDLRHMQEIINAERLQLQTILDVSPIGVGITVSNVLQFANPQFLSMVDTKIGAIVENIYVQPDERSRMMQQVFSHGKAMDFETQMYDKQGHIRDILVSYLPVNFKGERGVLGWLIDITERKRIEQQISASEGRLQAAAIAANLGLWDYDPTTGELLTNSNWVTMFGYAAQDLLQISSEENGKWSRFKGGIKQWITLLHPEDMTANEPSFFSMRSPEQSMFRGEFRVRCADGQWRWALVAGQVIEYDPQGHASRIVGILSDIDDAKNLQHALIAARDQAQEATRTKSDFLANMSHEIRTPMNAIIGMSHLALQTELDRKQRNYIEKVKQSAESLLGVINDILDFSKIEAGRLVIEHIEFNLEDVLDNLATLINYKAEAKGLELLFDIGPDVPVALMGDPLRLGQILVNLSNNAVKFTPTGEVVIAVKMLENHGQSCQLAFLVRDTGIGLSPEQQSRLFRSFSQADSSTTRKFGGTGLGLAISKHLVELLGGNIWVESSLGQGSTFGFTLTFALQTLPKPMVRKYLPELDGTKVLVVDDNKTAGEILTTMLRAMQFQVDYFSSALDALSAIRMANVENPYQLVVMDWKMPKMNGIELAKTLEYDLALSSTPRIILVTAYSRDEAMAAAKDIHIQAFLNKPVTPSTLLDAVMSALGREVVHGTGTQLKHADIALAVARLQGAHVLLVEDNEVNQELARELLEAQGIQVTIANHGQEALDLLAIHNFDGILMDCQMPVMDGYTATKLIRQQPQFVAIPIIAMTANAMAGDRELVLAAGMNDHIPKPINVHEMFETMARWISPSEPSQLKVVQQVAEDIPLSELPKIQGIDTHEGLQRILNQPALYHKLLVKTLKNQAEFPHQYHQAKFTENRIEQIRLVHSLKGVAGNLGAKELAAACQHLELQLNKQNGVESADAHDVSTDEQRVLAEFQTVMTGLQEYVRQQNSGSDAAKITLCADEVAQILRQLVKYADDFDTELIAQFTEHAESIRAFATPELYKRLDAAISQYDFATAASLLATLNNNMAE